MQSLSNYTGNRESFTRKLFTTYFGIDYDAYKFIQLCRPLNANEQNAIIFLVNSLKGAGIWHKADVIYPFVGRSAYCHQFNLKDPRKNADALICTFFGSPTHDANGVTTNGTSQYISSLYALTGNDIEHWEFVYDGALVSDQMAFVGGYAFGQYRTAKGAVNPQYWYRNSNSFTGTVTPSASYQTWPCVGGSLMNRTDATGFRVKDEAGTYTFTAPFSATEDMFGTMTLGGRSPLASTARVPVNVRLAAFGKKSLTPAEEDDLFSINGDFQTLLDRGL